MDNSVSVPVSFDERMELSPSKETNNNTTSSGSVSSSVSVSVSSIVSKSRSKSRKVKKRSSENIKSAKISSPCSHHQSIMQTAPVQIFLRIAQNSIVQKFLSIPISIFIFILVKKIFFQHKSLEFFFTWMEKHPNKGMAAYLIIYPFHMLLFLPGTPLVMGAGYIFMIRFGWLLGVSLCSVVTLFGSLIGSIWCFLLGRYCMRSSVRRWSKKYPLFDPIDAGKLSFYDFPIFVINNLTLYIFINHFLRFFSFGSG